MIKRGSLFAVCFAVVSISIFFYFGRNNSLAGGVDFLIPEQDERSHIPISTDNVLAYGIRINDISKILNKAIKNSNRNILPIRLSDSDFSYKTSKSWIYISDDEIRIFIYRDVADKLTKEEIMAVAIHEIGHVLLGHHDDVSIGVSTRDVEKEKQADLLAVRAGINPDLIISAIEKLSDPSDSEYVERIASLSNLTGPVIN